MSSSLTSFRRLAVAIASRHHRESAPCPRPGRLADEAASFSPPPCGVRAGRRAGARGRGAAPSCARSVPGTCSAPAAPSSRPQQTTTMTMTMTMTTTMTAVAPSR